MGLVMKLLLVILLVMISCSKAEKKTSSGESGDQVPTSGDSEKIKKLQDKIDTLTQQLSDSIPPDPDDDGWVLSSADDGGGEIKIGKQAHLRVDFADSDIGKPVTFRINNCDGVRLLGIIKTLIGSPRKFELSDFHQVGKVRTVYFFRPDGGVGQ